MGYETSLNFITRRNLIYGFDCSLHLRGVAFAERTARGVAAGLEHSVESRCRFGVCDRQV